MKIVKYGEGYPKPIVEPIVECHETIMCDKCKSMLDYTPDDVSTEKEIECDRGGWNVYEVRLLLCPVCNHCITLDRRCMYWWTDDPRNFGIPEEKKKKKWWQIF